MKIFCAYRKCRSGRCVKNVSQAARANRTDVNAALCRPLHPAAKVVRFCGPGHRKACSARALVARGQREGLDLEQYCLLFLALVRIGAPWTAALTMLQLVCGERADCMRQARFGWLQHMDPSDDQPATIRIAKVNGKTKAREIPVAPGVAALVHTWSTQGLTHGPSGARWPFAGDPERQAARRFLFPGCETGGAQGTRRNWAQPISVRGYRHKLAEAARVLQEERAANVRRSLSHPFDGFPLDRLGTHSFKRSAVTLMKDACTSTALCGAIAGTTARTLDRVYDTPTLKRQQTLVARVFGPVATTLVERAAPTPAGKKRAKWAPAPQGCPQQARFCAACGKRREEPSWACCPLCGHVY